jgi:hypothetical protein
LSGSGIGEALGRSLVARLGADCSAAAALAAAADLRRGGLLNDVALRGVPAGALRRAAADFETRGWLVRQGTEWHVPEAAMPRAIPAFLAGMAAMRGPAAEEEEALTAVTLPPPPSAVAAALPAGGVSHAALLSTEDAMRRVADAASLRFTVMSPFLDHGGLDFAVGLFAQTPARTRTLVVRRSGAARVALSASRARLESLGVTVLDYLLRTESGYETFHAKIVLADEVLAYVGSANLLTTSRRPLELGNVVRGQAARVVASVVRAIETVSLAWDWQR